MTESASLADTSTTEPAVRAPVAEPPQDGVADADERVLNGQIISTFPHLAEWCVERMAGDSARTDDRKDEVWELMREVILSRRTSAGRVPCIWVSDEDGIFATSCGGHWVFDSGTPAENKARFCPYCGGELIDRAASRPAAVQREPGTPSGVTMTHVGVLRKTAEEWRKHGDDNPGERDDDHHWALLHEQAADYLEATLAAPAPRAA